MKRKRFLAIFVLCSVLAMVSGTAIVHAQDDLKADIESYVVKNVDGSDVTDDHLMAGDTYVVSLEIEVGVSLGNNTLILSTPLEKAGDVYWRLENDYSGVDTDTWQPGQPEVEFNVVKGTAKFTLKGAVPEDYTSTEISKNGEFLHMPGNISLVQLSLGPEGTLLQQRSAEVSDQAIEAYRTALIQKRSLVRDATTDPNTADPKYVKLAEDVIERAEILSGKGYVEDAKDLLDTLPSSVSGFPIPVSQESFLPYIIGIVALAVILIVLIGLSLRARSNSSFIRQQVDEEAGRLDVLSVRISKIDKQLGAEIEQVKEQLERIIGR